MRMTTQASGAFFFVEDDGAGLAVKAEFLLSPFNRGLKALRGNGLTGRWVE